MKITPALIVPVPLQLLLPKITGSPLGSANFAHTTAEKLFPPSSNESACEPSSFRLEPDGTLRYLPTKPLSATAGEPFADAATALPTAWFEKSASKGMYTARPSFRVRVEAATADVSRRVASRSGTVTPKCASTLAATSKLCETPGMRPGVTPVPQMTTGTVSAWLPAVICPWYLL